MRTLSGIDFFGLKSDAIRESSSVTTGKSSSKRLTNEGTSATRLGAVHRHAHDEQALARAAASYIARRCGNSALQGSQ